MSETASELIVKIWSDILYSVIFEPHDYYVEIKVFEIIAFYEDGTFLYSKSLDNCNNDTENILEAVIYFNGSIKWDGCSDWDFKPSPYLKHFCEKQQASNIGTLLERLYDEAEKLMPNADFES